MADPAGNDDGVGPDRLPSLARRGLRWVFWGRIALQVVSLGFAVVLARVLSPSAFGLYGLAFVVLQFVNQIEGLRIEAALVQVKSLDEEKLAGGWSFALLFGAAATAVLFLLAGPLSELFGQPELKQLLEIGSLVFVVRAVFLPARVRLRRSLRFKALTVVEILRIVPAGVVAILMAVAGYGAFALLGYYLIRELVGGIALLVISKRWVWPSSSVRQARSLLSFGASSSASELVVFLLFNLPDLFVARFLGASPLGQYRQGVALVGRPVAFVDDILNKLAFPVLSRAWGDVAVVKAGFLNSIKILMALALPLLGLTYLLADEFVALLYGSQWKDAVPVVQVLAAIGIARILQPLNSAVFHASGAPQLELKINSVALVVLVASLWFAHPTSIREVALVVAVAYVLLSLIGLHFAAKIVGVSWVSLVRAMRYTIVALIVGGGIGVALMFWTINFSPITRAIGVVVLSGGAYFAVLALLDRQLLTDGKRLLLKNASVDGVESPATFNDGAKGSGPKS